MADGPEPVPSPPCPSCRTTLATRVRYPDDPYIWYCCISCGHRWCVHIAPEAESQ